MSSQCKRPLEHSVSSQPVKYLCHSAVERQASIGDASTMIYSIQGPVVINSTWAVACDVIPLDTPDLQSAKGSGSDMPEADGEIGCKEAWHNDLQVHTGCETLQDGVECCAVALEASAFSQVQERPSDRELNLPGKQLSSCALVGSVEPSLAGEWVPEQAMERGADGRRFEIQAEEGGMMMQDDNALEHHREVDWSSGTEESCLDSTTCLQSIKKTLEAWLLNCGRPSLVHMGEKEVDVLTLYMWVNIMGGYKKVTDSGSWGTISDCLGVTQNCGPGVKLVYAKYFMTHGTKTSLGLQAPTYSGKPSALQNLELALPAERKETHDESSEAFVGRQLPCSDEVVNQAGLNHIRSPWISQQTWTADGVRMQARQLPALSVYYEDPIQVESQAKEELQTTLEQLAHYGSQAPFPDQQPHSKRVPIGLDFQAHVLPWKSRDKACYYSGERGQEESRDDDDDTPPVSDDEESYDSAKWFGSKMWPLAGCKRVVNKSRDGRGRQASCLCRVPGSQECVRLHIETEHQKLFGEIGQTFELWGFDHMGERVATRWTKKEERTFRAVVRSNPQSQRNKTFWDELPSVFPSRSTSELVSYYFNVFVLRHRAMQNRVHAAKIDSDDDETELFDSGSDEDSSDDSSSTCEDRGRVQESRNPYEVDPEQMQPPPHLHYSSRQQESSFTHGKETRNVLHFQSLGDDDDDNGDSSQADFLRRGDEKVFHLDAEWKGKYCAEIWGEPAIEIAAASFEREKLLSTEGMIAELFGHK